MSSKGATSIRSPGHSPGHRRARLPGMLIALLFCLPAPSPAAMIDEASGDTEDQLAASDPRDWPPGVLPLAIDSQPGPRHTTPSPAEGPQRLTSGAGHEVLLSVDAGGWQLQPADPELRLSWRDPNQEGQSPVRHIRALLPGAGASPPLLWLDPSHSDILFDARSRRLVLDSAVAARECREPACTEPEGSVIEISLSPDGRQLLLDGQPYALAGLAVPGGEAPLVVISRSQTSAGQSSAGQ